MGVERGPTISLGPPRIGGTSGPGIKSFRPSFAPESSAKTSFNFASKIKPAEQKTPIRTPFEKPRPVIDSHRPDLNKDIFKNTRPINMGDISMPDRGGRLVVPGIVKNAMIVETKPGHHMPELPVNEGPVTGKLKDLLADTKPLRLARAKNAGRLRVNSDTKAETVFKEVRAFKMEYEAVKAGSLGAESSLQENDNKARPLREKLQDMEKRLKPFETDQKKNDEIKKYPNEQEKVLKETQELKNDIRAEQKRAEINRAEQAVELQKTRETYKALALVMGEEEAKSMIEEAVRQKGVVEKGEEERFVEEAVRETTKEEEKNEEEEKELVFEEDPNAQGERMRKAGDAVIDAQIRALEEGRDYILGSEVAARMPGLEANTRLISEIAVRVYDGSYLEAVRDISRLGRMETFFEAVLRVSEKIHAKPAVRIREVVTTKHVSDEDVKRVNDIKVEQILNKYLSKS